MTSAHQLVAVTKQELDAVERAGGRDSYAWKRLKQQFDEWQEHLAANRAEGEKLRRQWEAERAAAAGERRKATQAKQDAEAKAAAETLDADLRRKFFAANRSATEAEFQRLLPRLRDDELVRRTQQRSDDELAAHRAAFGAYRF